MSTPSAKLQIAVDGDTAIVKIVGRANFESSVPFKSVLAGLSEKTCRRYLLDLTECVLMDSTFLGVLSGFGVKFNAAQPPIALELLNPNGRISDLLENLGVAHLFVVRKSDQPAPTTLQSVESGEPPTHRDLSQTSLEAHRTLMDINPANVPKFKDVAQFLEEDLKRIKGG
jgi:anti-anti-sigma regulatory factor